jgi:hypothetical protein
MAEGIRHAMNPQPMQVWRGRNGHEYRVVARTPGAVEIEHWTWLNMAEFKERMIEQKQCQCAIEDWHDTPDDFCLVCGGSVA